MAKGFEQWEYPPDFSVPRKDLHGLSLNELRAVPFEELGRFKQSGRFLPGYSEDDGYAWSAEALMSAMHTSKPDSSAAKSDAITDPTIPAPSTIAFGMNAHLVCCVSMSNYGAAGNVRCALHSYNCPGDPFDLD